MRDAYRARRDALLSSLSENLAGAVNRVRPGGGYFIWLTLPSGPPTAELLRPAESQGVSFMPGGVFYLGGSPESRTIRLSFSRYDPPTLAEAGRRLAGAVRSNGFSASGD